MENFKKENVQYFLDMDLAELSEGTPLSEGNGVTEFQAEAEAVAAALKKAGVPAGRVPSGRARSLFLMRAFYFLGVFRGGEAARSAILDEEGEDALPLRHGNESADHGNHSAGSARHGRRGGQRGGLLYRAGAAEQRKPAAGEV